MVRASAVSCSPYLPRLDRVTILGRGGMIVSNLWVRSRNVEGMWFPYSGRFPIFCFPVWVQQSFSRKFKEMCRSGKRDDLCCGRTVKGGWESVLTIFYTRCCDKDSGVVLQLFFLVLCFCLSRSAYFSSS